MRDKRVVEIKKEIDTGIKMRMDQNGNLLVKRLCKCDVFMIKDGCGQDGDDGGGSVQAIKMDSRKSTVLFDMKQFQAELVRQMNIPNGPDSRTLEEMCFSFVAFGKAPGELLNAPVWIIIINLVALEMLVKVMPGKMIGKSWGKTFLWFTLLTLSFF